MEFDYGSWLKRGLGKGGHGTMGQQAAKLAKRLKLSPNYLHTFMRNERALTDEQIEIISEFFGEPVPAKSQRDNVFVLKRPVPSAHLEEVVTCPIIGTAEAGTFREADLLDQVEQRFISAPRSSAFPNAKPMAWEVRGDSMDQARMQQGDIIFGVDFQDAGGVLTNNSLVVVERSRDGSIERSVKCAAVFEDRVEFQPRSSNPVHKPIIYFNKGVDQTGYQVKVLTIIEGSFLNFR